VGIDSVRTHLRLQITMDVTELVELADSGEHLADVEPRVFFFENT